MAFFCLILLGLLVHTQAIDLSDDMKLEHLVAKHCERYVNVKIEGIQEKHGAEIATLKSELAKSKIEMDIMKTELKKQRKVIETLTAKTDQAIRTEHFSDSRETLTANTDQAIRTEHFSDLRETLTANTDQATKTEHFSDSRGTLTENTDQATRTEHFSDSREILTANTDEAKRTEHFSDSRETLTANTEKSNKLQHLLNSTTEVPVAKIDRQNRPERGSVAGDSIQSGETLTKESGSKVVETKTIDDQPALSSKGVRIRRDVTRVAFFAYVTIQTEHLGQNQDIVFDHVVTNIGNAYNGNHGVFIAPVQGTYVFSCTLAEGNSAATWGHFVVNRNIVAKFSLDTYKQASQTVVVTLNAGDDVSIQHAATDRIIAGDRYSTFSGFLLYNSGSEEIIG